jgi:hypothetical protein
MRGRRHQQTHARRHSPCCPGAKGLHVVKVRGAPVVTRLVAAATAAAPAVPAFWNARRALAVAVASQDMCVKSNRAGWRQDTVPSSHTACPRTNTRSHAHAHTHTHTHTHTPVVVAAAAAAVAAVVAAAVVKAREAAGAAAVIVAAAACKACTAVMAAAVVSHHTRVRCTLAGASGTCHPCIDCGCGCNVRHAKPTSIAAAPPVVVPAGIAAPAAAAVPAAHASRAPSRSQTCRSRGAVLRECSGCLRSVACKPCSCARRRDRRQRSPKAAAIPPAAAVAAATPARHVAARSVPVCTCTHDTCTQSGTSTG